MMAVFSSPTAIVMFTVAILQQAVQSSLPISSLRKRVLNFMRNPKLVQVLFDVIVDVAQPEKIVGQFNIGLISY